MNHLEEPLIDNKFLVFILNQIAKKPVSPSDLMKILKDNGMKMTPILMKKVLQKLQTFHIVDYRCGKFLINMTPTCLAQPLRIRNCCSTSELSWEDAIESKGVVDDHHKFIKSKCKVDGRIKGNVKPLNSRDMLKRILEAHVKKGNLYKYKNFYYYASPKKDKDVNDATEHDDTDATEYDYFEDSEDSCSEDDTY